MTRFESPDSNACLSSPGGPLYDLTPVHCDECHDPINEGTTYRLGEDYLCAACGPLEAVLVLTYKTNQISDERRQALQLLEAFVKDQALKIGKDTYTLSLIERVER